MATANTCNAGEGLTHLLVIGPTMRKGKHDNHLHTQESQACLSTPRANRSRMAYHIVSWGLPPSAPLAERPNKVSTGSGANFTARYGSHCGPDLHCE